MGIIDVGTLTPGQWVTLIVGALSFLGVVLAAILGGGWIGHRWAHQRGMEDLNLRARVETTKTFLLVSSRAHGFPENRQESVGAGEQVAAIYLLADMGDRDPWLYWAATKQLEDQLPWMTNHSTLARQALEQAQKQLESLPGPTDNSAPVRHERARLGSMVAEAKQLAESKERLRAAAEDARARISPPVTGWWGIRFWKYLRAKLAHFKRRANPKVGR